VISFLFDLLFFIFRDLIDDPGNKLQQRVRLASFASAAMPHLLILALLTVAYGGPFGNRHPCSILFSSLPRKELAGVALGSRTRIVRHTASSRPERP